MFISKEFQKLLADYRRYKGNRIYAVYESMDERLSREYRTKKAGKALKASFRQADRAIRWGREKRTEEKRISLKAA